MPATEDDDLTKAAGRRTLILCSCGHLGSRAVIVGFKFRGFGVAVPVGCEEVSFRGGNPRLLIRFLASLETEIEEGSIVFAYVYRIKEEFKLWAVEYK